MIRDSRWWWDKTRTVPVIGYGNKLVGEFVEEKDAEYISNTMNLMVEIWNVLCLVDKNDPEQHDAVKILMDKLKKL